MKVHLLYPDRDYEARMERTGHENDLTGDLGLDILLHTMAGDDKYLRPVCASVLFDGLDSPQDIAYRQAVLKDCLKNPDTVRALYRIIEQTLEEKRKSGWGVTTRYLSSVMSSATTLLELLFRMLKDLRRIADEHGKDFTSQGLTRLFTMLQAELSDAYFKEIETHLRHLRFNDGILVSAGIGRGSMGEGYTLHNYVGHLKNKLKWSLASKINVPPRDDSGASDLTRRRDRATNLAANAVAQSAEHILSFCEALHTEVGFYVGCLNLSDAMRAKGQTVCYPVPRGRADRAHTFTGLYDICLSLTSEGPVIGQDVDMGARNLAVITGANQGGKSTFLRSIGQAQLMMESGMFVAAESFTANLASGVYTHYKREEDASMTSGKLDEELYRMSKLVDEMRPGGMILFNESFASTNEREGSEIARQIINALLDEGMKVFLVTHMFDLSGGFLRQYGDKALFLRAARQADGTRTFCLVEGEPLPTSYGEDLYRNVFGNEA